MEINEILAFENERRRKAMVAKSGLPIGDKAKENLKTAKAALKAIIGMRKHAPHLMMFCFDENSMFAKLKEKDFTECGFIVEKFTEIDPFLIALRERTAQNYLSSEPTSKTSGNYVITSVDVSESEDMFTMQAVYDRFVMINKHRILDLDHFFDYKDAIYESITDVWQSISVKNLYSYPCVVQGILSALKKSSLFTYDEHDPRYLAGKSVVVLNRSPLIGIPLYMGLLGFNATACLIHTQTPADMANRLISKADIVISATGCPHVIRKGMVKPGAFVIDCGGTVDSNGNYVGDVDYDDVSEDAIVTPISGGGVGLWTRTACIEQATHYLTVAFKKNIVNFY